jgi:hypothetical protein
VNILELLLSLNWHRKLLQEFSISPDHTAKDQTESPAQFAVFENYFGLIYLEQKWLSTLF